MLRKQQRDVGSRDGECRRYIQACIALDLELGLGGVSGARITGMLFKLKSRLFPQSRLFQRLRTKGYVAPN